MSKFNTYIVFLWMVPLPEGAESPLGLAAVALLGVVARLLDVFCRPEKKICAFRHRFNTKLWTVKIRKKICTPSIRK